MLTAFSRVTLFPVERVLMKILILAAPQPFGGGCFPRGKGLFRGQAFSFDHGFLEIIWN